MTISGEPDNASQFIWHHLVHEMWEESRLCIWRLKFNPTYDGETIKSTILGVFEDLNILSYAMYELLGFNDLLLRLWMPRGISLARFEEEIGRALFELDYEDSEYFEVSSIVRHWVWETSNADRRPRSPSAEQLLLKPDSNHLRRIVELTTGEIGVEDLTIDDRTILDMLVDGNCLTEMHHNGGIAFIIIIKRSIAAGSRQQRKNLLDHVTDTCDEISDRYNAQLSLYDGTSEYLLIGRLGFAEFHDGMVSLIQRLNEAGLSKYLRSRTFTSIALGPKFAAYREGLATIESESAPTASLEELLIVGETDEIEFKSSAFANLKRWLRNPTEPRPVRDSSVPLDGYVKAVCGLLNSRLRGAIIIGVGERVTLVGKSPAEVRARASELLSPYPLYAGDLVLFGMDADALASPGLDWDNWVREVQDSLMSHISPNPIANIQITREDFLGKVFLIIRTVPPKRDWFYVEYKENDVRFYVRANAETRALYGRDQDVFKAAHER
ncbi:MAG: AlbA family DNA-binding domain-containing protein [Acidimicrobiales bacterium]